jgi:hypothetical protein
MRTIKGINIHCSASSFGSASLIREWHLKRGFKDIGYHFVILNGWINKDTFIEPLVGQIEVGRDLKLDPASIKGHNKGQISICMIGDVKSKFHEKQFKSLISLLEDLRKRYGIGIDKILGHREIASNKLCPCFDVGKIREILSIRRELKIKQ